MLLGFKERFAPLVQEGSKTHTIRARRKLTPKAGETCHCYTGLRQKGARLLGRWRCTRVEDIRIEAEYYRIGREVLPVWLRIWIEGAMLTESEMNQICWQDGFRGESPWMEFSSFWQKEHGKRAASLSFQGVIIHWDFNNKSFSSAGQGRSTRRRQ